MEWVEAVEVVQEEAQTTCPVGNWVALLHYIRTMVDAAKGCACAS